MVPLLLIEFVPGTRVHRDDDVVSGFPIVQNGPPGTRVSFPDGREVPLPTDQIVSCDDAQGAARVGFGGMRFVGLEGGQLVFHRVQDLAPAEALSPERGRRMTLERWMVAAVLVGGVLAWPAADRLQ